MRLLKCGKENEEERNKRIEMEKRKIDAAENGRRIVLKSEIERAKRLLSENGYVVTKM